MDNVVEIIQRYSKLFIADEILVQAIIKKETNWVPCRTRYEPGWRYFYNPAKYAQHLFITIDTEKVLQAQSWGLMQIMGSVARELGFDDYMPKLIEPENGLMFGIKKLSQLSFKYDDIRDVISAYNAGEPKKIGGLRYINQEYVDDVMNNYAIYKQKPHE